MRSKIIKYAWVPLLLLVVPIGLAQSTDVAYIVSNLNLVEDTILNVLDDMNLTVDVIDNDDILQTSLAPYKFMLVADNVFFNEDEIPVNDIPALLLNTRYMDEWHWTARVSKIVASRPLEAYVNDPTHFITAGLPSTVPVYNSADTSYSYLHRNFRAPTLNPVLAVSGSGLDYLNAVIATVEQGTQLRDGVQSNVKSVFFGIRETDHWTATSEQLFRNSILWLSTDFIPPQLSNITATNITNSSAIVRWNTDKDSDSQVQYGTTTLLALRKSTAAPTTDHEIRLEGLLEDTLYYYTITSCNEDNFCSESELFNFTTDDYTAPYLISISTRNITNVSAIIDVEISENGFSYLNYGVSSNDLVQVTVQSNEGSVFNFTLSDLNEKTTYYSTATMCDDSGNCGNSSLFNFATFDWTPPQAPQGLFIEVENADNSIVLSWDVAVDDAVEYNVYTSSHPTNFDFNSPIATVTENEFIDAAAAAAAERYYVVRAQDAADNEENNTNVVGKFDIALEDGYNLVSLPLIPQTNDLGEILHHTLLYNPVSEIKQFNRETQEFESQHYLGFWNPLSFQELYNGEGYFFKSDETVNFTVVGTPPETTVTELKQGMNLFGTVSLEGKEISDVAGIEIVEIGRFTGTEYDLATHMDGTWHNTFTLEPSQGYWAKATANHPLMLTS